MSFDQIKALWVNGSNDGSEKNQGGYELQQRNSILKQSLGPLTVIHANVFLGHCRFTGHRSRAHDRGCTWRSHSFSCAPILWGLRKPVRGGCSQKCSLCQPAPIKAQRPSFEEEKEQLYGFARQRRTQQAHASKLCPPLKEDSKGS